MPGSKQEGSPIDSDCPRRPDSPNREWRSTLSAGDECHAVRNRKGMVVDSRSGGAIGSGVSSRVNVASIRSNRSPVSTPSPRIVTASSAPLASMRSWRDVRRRPPGSAWCCRKPADRAVRGPCRLMDGHVECTGACRRLCRNARRRRRSTPAHSIRPRSPCEPTRMGRRASRSQRP